MKFGGIWRDAKSVVVILHSPLFTIQRTISAAESAVVRGDSIEELREIHYGDSIPSFMECPHSHFHLVGEGKGWKDGECLRIFLSAQLWPKVLYARRRMTRHSKKHGVRESSVNRMNLFSSEWLAQSSCLHRCGFRFSRIEDNDTSPQKTWLRFCSDRMSQDLSRFFARKVCASLTSIVSPSISALCVSRRGFLWQ